MKVSTNFETQETVAAFQVLRKRPGTRCYIVKSSMGTFLAFTFHDAMDLARKIFTVKGCWALILF